MGHGYIVKIIKQFPGGQNNRGGGKIIWGQNESRGKNDMGHG